MFRFLMLAIALIFSAPALAGDSLDVNSRRLAKFNEIAKAQGQDLATVQAVAGADFINRTASGNYVMNAAGQWVKK
jgi:uncharacterized protein YdbL (DUF1318 family)